MPAASNLPRIFAVLNTGAAVRCKVTDGTAKLRTNMTLGTGRSAKTPKHLLYNRVSTNVAVRKDPQTRRARHQGRSTLKKTGKILKPFISKLLVTLACLAPAMVSAQTPPDDFFSDCPALSIQQRTTLHWEPIRAPNMLFCRAVRDDGSAAFALTFSRESPFNPRGSNRAEVGNFMGQGVQWYRSTVATDPNALIREALIDFGDGHVLHISTRASDPQTLARQQRDVLALTFPRQQQFGGGN